MVTAGVAGVTTEWRSRVEGQVAESTERLHVQSNLARSLSRQGKYADAERIQREVLGERERVLGAEHPRTLSTANNLAATLSNQGKHSEAEAIQHEVLGVQKRVLGPEHPDTLTSANNLATVLAYQCKHAEAEQILQASLASCHRVLGTTHPITLQIETSLENVRAAIRAKPLTNVTTPTATGASLPAGTRVLVQRLVGKPELNGKRARVLSFDARTGRYAAALDDGQELSLKAEWVTRAGCAAAGCASEEASTGSVCGRCQAVRYCSRECQRADWEAHKPACFPPHMAPPVNL
jgi:hypothetical protein